MSDAFRQQIKYIYGKLPINKQSVAFSATFTDDLLLSLNDFVKDPHIVKLTYDLPTLEEVQQYYVDVKVKNEDIDSPSTHQVGDYFRRMQTYKDKFEATADLLSKVDFYQCMIFVNSFPRAAELAQWLTDMGWRSGHICAGLSQEKRMSVMNDMRQFKLRVLVCSDLIARGIDIDRVNLVINIDYPRNTETYLHRVGRTGRYGTSGIAVNLVATSEDRAFLTSLHDQHVSIPRLPDHVSFSDYRKELDQDEQKLWQQHQGQRIDKEGKSLKFTNDNKNASTVSKHQRKSISKDQPNRKRARTTKEKGKTNNSAMISSSLDHIISPDTNNNTIDSNRIEKDESQLRPGKRENFKTHPVNVQQPHSSTTWDGHHRQHQHQQQHQQPLMIPPYPSLPTTPTYFAHHGLPAPFILPPNPLFPSNNSKKNSHWIPPDLYF
ncbi:unnamed protein product [Absidia cylindrospora]